MDSFTGFLRTTLRIKKHDTVSGVQDYDQDDDNLPGRLSMGQLPEGSGHRLSESSRRRTSIDAATPRPSGEADIIITNRSGQEDSGEFSSPLSQVSNDSNWTTSTTGTSYTVPVGIFKFGRPSTPKQKVAPPPSSPLCTPASSSSTSGVRSSLSPIVTFIPGGRAGQYQCQQLSHETSSSNLAYNNNYATYVPTNCHESHVTYIPSTAISPEDVSPSRQHHRYHNSLIRYQIFGLPLEQAVELDGIFVGDQLTIVTPVCEAVLQPLVPLLVRKCISFLTEFGLEEEGIYRVSGSASAVRQLQVRFANEGPTFELDPEIDDVHTVASLIKQYFQKLPRDLLPIQFNKRYAYDLESALGLSRQNLADEVGLQSNDMHDSSLDEDIDILKQIYSDLVVLPPTHFALLHILIRHLWMVAQCSGANRMSLVNLALIFSPTLRIKRDLLMALIAKGDLPANILYQDWKPVQHEKELIQKPEPAAKRRSVSRRPAHDRVISFDFNVSPSSTADIY